MAVRSKQTTSATDFLPGGQSLAALKRAAQTCRGCPLYQNATQTVFGNGNVHARLLFVGEQPGDQEDVQGKPFVGPAGKLLRALIEEAGIDIHSVYLTNAVKHFKWTPSGKRRLHAKPTSREISACRPWLVAELNAIQPELILCLGATAAQSLLGSQFRLTKSRGQLQESEFDVPILATYHPSAVLRAPNGSRAEMRATLLADLKTATKWLKSHA